MNEQWIDRLRAEPVDIDPRPGFKAELRARIVAERDGSTTTSSPVANLHRRWWLLAAAGGCVALLIGGLVVFGSDDRALTPSTVPEQTPATTPVTVPSTTAETASTTVPKDSGAPPTIESTTDDLRFPNPLAVDVVAVLDPAPLEPVNANAATGDTFPDIDWAQGRNGSTDVWVIDDGEWAGTLSVTDFAIPWDIATNGITPTRIDDVEAVIDVERSMVVLRRDDGVRRIQGGTDSQAGGDPALLDAATQLAELVGIHTLDAVLLTNEFVPVVRTEALSPSVTHDFTVEVQVVRFERPPTINELRWAAAMFARSSDVEQIGPWAFVATQGPSRKRMLELVSPVDAVLIDALSDADLDAYRNSLQFPTVAESGLTVIDDRPVETGEVVARGEQNWGRWTVKRSSDGACQSVTTAEWTPGGLVPYVLTTGPTCTEAPPTDPLACFTSSFERTVVIVVGANASSVTLEAQDGLSSTGFVDGEGGAAALVERSSSASDQTTVRIDGATYSC